MKFTQLLSFEKHLKEADPSHLSTVYLLIAKESFDRRTALDALLNKLLPSDQAKVCGLLAYEVEQLPTFKLNEALYAMGLFASKQVIVLHGAEKLEKPLMAILETYFSRLNPHLCLIITGQLVNKNTNFYKKAEKVGVVLDLIEEKSKNKESSALQLILATMINAGKKIEPVVAQRLIRLLGTASSHLHSELQKLICYVGSREVITNADVDQIVTPLSLENSWQLAEALFSRDCATALRISKALLLEGCAFFALLRMLRAQFQTEFQICAILKNGGSALEVSQTFPYMKGYILERHLSMAKNYGLRSFKMALIEIDKMELQAKNSSLNPELLIELLMIKLASY